MNNHPFFTPLPARFLQFVAVMVNALLALLPLEPSYNFMSSVSWNG
jgi:hypothetical protein